MLHKWYGAHEPARGPHALWRCRPGDDVSPWIYRDGDDELGLSVFDLVASRRVSHSDSQHQKKQTFRKRWHFVINFYVKTVLKVT